MQSYRANQEWRNNFHRPETHSFEVVPYWFSRNVWVELLNIVERIIREVPLGTTTTCYIPGDSCVLEQYGLRMQDELFVEEILSRFLLRVLGGYSPDFRFDIRSHDSIIVDHDFILFQGVRMVSWRFNHNNNNERVTFFICELKF